MSALTQARRHERGGGEGESRHNTKHRTTSRVWNGARLGCEVTAVSTLSTVRCVVRLSLFPHAHRYCINLHLGRLQHPNPESLLLHRPDAESPLMAGTLLILFIVLYPRHV